MKYITKITIKRYVSMSVGIICAVALSGCTPAIDAELGLIEQSRRGLALIRESADARQQVVDAYFALRRQQLDEAFDDDLKINDGSLTTIWVQQARQAYALGLEAIASAEVASRDAARTSADNTAAVELCLDELKALNLSQRIFAPAAAASRAPELSTSVTPLSSFFVSEKLK
jgi:hypothetical protein